MTTQLVIDIANRINQIDPRISARAEGGMIKGTFRGKQHEDYAYMVTERKFYKNNAGNPVNVAVEKAMTELYKY